MQASDAGIGLGDLANESRSAVGRVVVYKNNFPEHVWERLGNGSDHALDIVSFIKGWDYDRQFGGFQAPNRLNCFAMEVGGRGSGGAPGFDGMR